MRTNPRAMVSYALLIAAAFLVSAWFLAVAAVILLIDVAAELRRRLA